MPDGPVRLLLIEDEVLNRALVRATLACADDFYDTLRADIAEGRSAIETGRFDVLLLDVRLPDGNGLELAASLPQPRPLMVALTASVVPSPRELAAQAGCDAFLEKPFQPRELQGVLTRLLDGVTAA